MGKWKFIHNGEGWWLRIEDLDQLEQYFTKTNQRFGDSMMEIARNHSNGKECHCTNGLSTYLELFASNSKLSLFEATSAVMWKCLDAYVSILKQKGYVNINSVGGCNGEDYDIKLTDYRDTLVFPNYDDKSIKIKTWEWEDKKAGNIRSNYKYHYYAYIGNIQIKDGEKVKWDTYEEAYAFAKKYVTGSVMQE